MTPQERVAYAARLLDAAGPTIQGRTEGISDDQMLVEVGRCQAVAALAQAHVAVALAQHTSVLTTITDHVVQSAEPWQRGDIRPCPGNTAHVAHRHYDDGLGEWWCPGVPIPVPQSCGERNNWPHEPHLYDDGTGVPHQCWGIPDENIGRKEERVLAPEPCILHRDAPHEPHRWLTRGRRYWCPGVSE